MYWLQSLWAHYVCGVMTNNRGAEAVSNRENEIIKLWGTPASYHNLLKEFVEEHSKAHLRTTDNEGCLVSVTYMFPPYQVWLDNENLKEAIMAEMNKEDSQ